MIKIVNDKNLIFDVWKYDVILVPMSINNSMNLSLNSAFEFMMPCGKDTTVSDLYLVSTLL